MDQIALTTAILAIPKGPVHLLQQPRDRGTEPPPTRNPSHRELTSAGRLTLDAAERLGLTFRSNPARCRAST